VDGFTVGEAAARTGWSSRMLRYLERVGLVVPRRTRSGYRVYGPRELGQLRSLRELRGRFGAELTELAFAARLRREPELRLAVESWLDAARVHVPPSPSTPAWVDWDQRKHERLLAA
jgi:DNA-binding transcriptional MerR regulator